MKYLILALIILTSCSYSSNKEKAIDKTLNDKNEIVSDSNIVKGDSLYKIGDFLFEASRAMKFEFVKRGDPPKVKTKGDTLYSDNELIILGDWTALTSPGIYKKF